jgi:hypothetical protein
MQFSDKQLLNGPALDMDDGQTVAVYSVQQPVSEADRVGIRNFNERKHSTGLDVDAADLFAVRHEHARAVRRAAAQNRR